MKYEKKLAHPELLADWGIKGIYNEYGLERTFCGCGHVEDKKIYVCPECGNTEFHPTQDWGGHVMKQTSPEVFFRKNAADGKPELVVDHKWLIAHRDPSDPANMLLSEDTVSEVVFREGNYYSRYNGPRDILETAMRKYASKFSPSTTSLIAILDEMGKDITRVGNYLHLNSPKFFELANDLLESKEYVLLGFLMDHHPSNKPWGTAEEELILLDIPRFLWRDRNNINILNAFGQTSYYNRVDLSKIEALWSKIPIDIQNAILLYLRQGLIDPDQMKNMVFIDERLLKESPEAQAKIIKKYFANFHMPRYAGYRTYHDKRTVTEMYDFYDEEGLPISAETFDFRSWRAMVNARTINEVGYDEATVAKILEDMDKSPIDSILALGQLRRPRKKKTP